MDPYVFAAGLLFGSLGMWLVKEAKKQSSVPLFFISFAMIGYTYIITDPVWCWLVGFGLIYGAYKFWRS